MSSHMFLKEGSLGSFSLAGFLSVLVVQSLFSYLLLLLCIIFTYVCIHGAVTLTRYLVVLVGVGLH